MDIKNTIVNLIILGQLDTGMKLNTRGKIFVLDDYNLYQGIFRFIRRDDRNITLEKLELLVKDVKTIVETLNDALNNDNQNNTNTVDYEITLEKMKEHIGQGLSGLYKLRETYIDDKTMWARLNFEIGTLEQINESIKVKTE